MPQLDLYQVDAFSAAPFGGNPAAVVPLDAWLPDATLQRIAEENNLSETAYVVRRGDLYDLRWFTPAVEVDLCGHATLATAWVLFEQLGAKDEVLRFATRSGELQVRRAGDGLAMDFPAKQPVAEAVPPGLLQALGLAEARALYRTDDYLVVIDDEALIDGLKPDFAALAAFDVRGVAVTAPSAGRRERRPGDRLRAHLAGAVLGAAAGQDGPERRAGRGAQGAAALRGARQRPRHHQRAGGAVPARRDLPLRRRGARRHYRKPIASSALQIRATPGRA
ncbi:PhzF family phenazine biosynthesis protein [Achromobacter insuavis]|uniref:PhzF family phenazine biosynthesis protein n=1 Tax=Achromobacter insuavis TaxID=1287735 RepID=UPI004038B4D5